MKRAGILHKLFLYSGSKRKESELLAHGIRMRKTESIVTSEDIKTVELMPAAFSMLSGVALVAGTNEVVFAPREARRLTKEQYNER